MRASILLAGTALALAACRNNDQAGNTSQPRPSLTAENFVSNDVTAIDAVTGVRRQHGGRRRYLDDGRQFGE